MGSDGKETVALPELAADYCHSTEYSPQHGGKESGCPLGSAVLLLGQQALYSTGTTVNPKTLQFDLAGEFLFCE